MTNPAATRPGSVPLDRRTALQHRRELLRARSALLRFQLGQQATVLEAPLSAADRVRDGWRWARAHASWIAGGAALVAALRPRRSVRWAMRLLWAWRTWRRVQGLIGPVVMGTAPPGRRPG